MKEMLIERKLVYQRINNNKLNKINKDSTFCSIFYDWKK